MRFSPLLSQLFDPALPKTGYEVELFDAAGREALWQEASRAREAVVTSAPHVTMVEIADRLCLYLFTLEGHFAHCSVLQRRSVKIGGRHEVRVHGWSMAPEGVGREWMRQFQLQDEMASASFGAAGVRFNNACR
jgi:hypothetical protein